MDIKFPDIIFYLINFGVVTGLLTYLVYKPVLNILEERRRKIEEGQIASEEAIKNASLSEEMKNKIIKEAEAQGQEKATQIIKKAQEEAKNIIAKTRAESQEEMERMASQFEAEKTQVLESWKKKFEAQVFKTAQKVIGASINESKAKDLVEKDLEQLMSKI